VALSVSSADPAVLGRVLSALSALNDKVTSIAFETRAGLKTLDDRVKAIDADSARARAGMEEIHGTPQAPMVIAATVDPARVNAMLWHAGDASLRRTNVPAPLVPATQATATVPAPVVPFVHVRCEALRANLPDRFIADGAVIIPLRFDREHKADTYFIDQVRAACWIDLFLFSAAARLFVATFHTRSSCLFSTTIEYPCIDAEPCPERLLASTPRVFRRAGNFQLD
jgi:hypothetical protein